MKRAWFRALGLTFLRLKPTTWWRFNKTTYGSVEEPKLFGSRI